MSIRYNHVKQFWKTSHTKSTADLLFPKCLMSEAIEKSTQVLPGAKRGFGSEKVSLSLLQIPVQFVTSHPLPLHSPVRISHEEPLSSFSFHDEALCPQVPSESLKGSLR